jgi:uncharacterized protein (TIGR03792 family)
MCLTNRWNGSVSVVVIERLEVDVDPADRDGFLAKDRAVWTSFLAAQPGFRHKEVWVEPDHPGVLIMNIWWETKDHWKAITEAQCNEVDALMGQWLRIPRMREFVLL